MSDVEWDHDGACDQKTHEVRDHQATEEDEKEGAGAVLCSLEGLDEDYEGDEIRAEAQDHEDGWIPGGGDGVAVVEWRAVVDVAEWGVVSERQGGGVHGGQRVLGRWFRRLKDV